MAINRALFSSATDQWATPPTIYAELDAEFGFTLDVCAQADNAKCARYFDEAQDGLKQEWSVWVDSSGRPCACRCHESSVATAAKRRDETSSGPDRQSATASVHSARPANGTCLESDKQSEGLTRLSEPSLLKRSDATQAQNEVGRSEQTATFERTTSAGTDITECPTCGGLGSGESVFSSGVDPAPTAVHETELCKTTSFRLPMSGHQEVCPGTSCQPAQPATSPSTHGLPTPGSETVEPSNSCGSTCGACLCCMGVPATAWCNPPYGRGIEAWVKKAYESAQAGATVVCLLPSRTDTQWWHRWVMGKASEVRLVEGRLRFGDQTKVAPFPSVFVIFRPGDHETKVVAWKPKARKVPA